MNRIPRFFFTVVSILLVITLTSCGSGGGGGDGDAVSNDSAIAKLIYVLLSGDEEIISLHASRMDDDDAPEINNTDDDPVASALSKRLASIYVANQSDDSVTVYDANTLDFEFRILTGDSPVALTVNEDLGVLYVVAGDDSRLEVYDAETGDFLDDVATGDNPVEVVWYDFFNFVFVCCEGDGHINVFSDEDVDDFMGNIDVADDGGAGPISISLDGARNQLFVACRDSDNLLCYNAATFAFIDALPTGDEPIRVLASSYLNRVFVANGGDDTVSGWVISDRSPLANSPNALSGSSPGQMAVNGKYQLLYVPNRTSGTVSVFTANTLSEFGPSPYPVGSNPRAVLSLGD